MFINKIINSGCFKEREGNWGYKMNQIINKNCLDGLKELPAGCVNTCVTSPPYFGLRDYGCAGQIGLEPTPQDFVDALVAVFREVKRVLRDDATIWVNLGDSYNAAGRKGHGTRTGCKQGTNRASDGGHDNCHPSVDCLKEKDLIGIPWRVAFALQADGWYLRQDIIWAKPNPMPESVTDRCTKSHEYIFLLSKGPKYYFDHKAIQEPIAESSKSRLNQNVSDQVGSGRVPGKTNGNMKAVGCYNGKRNKRDVWTVATKPCKEAHFATFPPELIRPCILAGCPTGGLVLDPFMGTGTVAVVSIEERRKYVGFELNPEYINIAHKRMKDLQVKLI